MTWNICEWVREMQNLLQSLDGSRIQDPPPDGTEGTQFLASAGLVLLTAFAVSSAFHYSHRVRSNNRDDDVHDEKKKNT